MRRRLPASAEVVPNLAPMVDIIIVILVFFMLGASLTLAREGVLATDLDPRSGPGAGVAVEIIPAVKIALADVDDGRDCRVLLMGRPLAGGLAELARRLEERHAAGADPTAPVVLAAEAPVRWEFVVQAMDAAIGAGFRNVQFAVALPGAKQTAE